MTLLWLPLAPWDKRTDKLIRPGDPMKPIILLIALFIFTFSSKVFSQVIERDLNAVVKGKDIEVFTQEFSKFINSEFIASDYCQEGWGDEDGPVRMQKACKEEQALLNKEIEKGSWAWMKNFDFDRAKITSKTIRYEFHRFLKLSPDAPLSCVVSLELTVTRKTKEAKLDFFDLYCDH